MSAKPDSKAARARAADKLIRNLLRTPKTRPGLIAAVTSATGVTRNFIYGWLSERTVDGTVTVFKGAGRNLTYQITTHVVIENAREGTFPSWLEPRVLPMATSRGVFISGHKNKSKKDSS